VRHFSREDFSRHIDEIRLYFAGRVHATRTKGGFRHDVMARVQLTLGGQEAMTARSGSLRSVFGARVARITKPALVALLACAAMLVLPAASQASTSGLSNAGTDFWLGFPSNYGTPELTLYITGSTATTGTVTVTGESFSEGFSVTPGTVTAVKLPAGTQMAASEVVEEKAIHVTAGAPVVVYGLSDLEYTTDAYTALPSEVVGTTYTVLAYGSGGASSEFSVVATQENTEVTITPSVQAGSHAAGVPYTVTLNQGQEYQLQAYEDLTGTKITSTAPISVFGGNQCADIPDGYAYCDYIVEQDVPDAAWGTSFLTEPLKTRLNGDYFELVADQNETEVTLNGNVIAKLNAGEHYSQEVEGAGEWSSNKPIELAQYANGTTYDGVMGDPSMTIIPPYQQFEAGYTITTPVNSKTKFVNYVNLVVPKSAVGLIAVDGTPVPASEYNSIGSSEFEGVQVNLEPGSHVITGNGQPFGAFMYGFSPENAYGYYGGMSLAPVAEVTNVTLSPATETALVGTEECVTATVTDQNGNPLPSVRVDFLVSGANTAEGSVFAGPEGEATFCYTGANLGDDTITGAVGAIKGSAAKTWVAELPKEEVKKEEVKKEETKKEEAKKEETKAPEAAAAVLPFKAAVPAVCTSKRNITIHIQHVKQFGLVSAVIEIDGKDKRTLKGKHLTAAINLVGMPKGTFTVEIIARRRDGKIVKGERVYHTCVSKLPGHSYLPLVAVG
jgi:hypothetical protein